MKNKDKWFHEYIENVDLSKIEWKNLNTSELSVFFKENYYDKDVWYYVLDEDASSLYPTLFGMTYLNLNSPKDNNRTYNFLLGIVDNNIGKKTIVSSIIYLDSYNLFKDQDKPLTYISTVEVNSYFRNKGIFTKMCQELLNFINPEQHILTSHQSRMGEKIHLVDKFTKILMDKGFQNYILKDYHNHSTFLELHDKICSKLKTLKR